jgi:hypothetical protein
MEHRELLKTLKASRQKACFGRMATAIMLGIILAVLVAR